MRQGGLVVQINLGAQSTGLANFSWDGKLQDGSQAPAGQYSLSAQFNGGAAGATAATTYVNGVAQSVTIRLSMLARCSTEFPKVGV